MNGYVDGDFWYSDNTKSYLLEYWGTESTVIIPSTVDTIADRAFENRTNLTSLKIMSAYPPALAGTHVFPDGGYFLNYYVHCRTTSVYQEAWNANYTFIEAWSQYDVTDGVNDPEMGSVAAAYCYPMATLTATANSGYHFEQWSDGDITNPRSVRLTQDTALTAIFAEGAPNTGVDPSQDTVFVYDTIIVHDTTRVYVYVHDTTIYNSYQYDTSFYNRFLYDTTLVNVHVNYYIYDTTVVNNYYYDTTIMIDTVFVERFFYDTVSYYYHDTVENNHYYHDTTYVYLHDTVLVYVNHYVFDTTFVNNYIHDTLWLTRYIHDTVYLHDTIVVGVDEVEVTSTKIYISDGQIVVDGAEGNQVWLYDAVGRLMATKQEDFSTIRFNVSASGTYLVKVGNHPARRVVVIR